MLKLLGFCQLAIVSGIGANFLANVALANSLSGGNTDLTDALILSGGFGGGLGGGFGGRGINAALNTAVTANALGSLGGNGLLGAAILANGFNGNGGFGFNNNFRPAYDLSGNYYYSSSYYVPPATILPTYDPTYLPTTYLPTYIPPATTYLPTTTTYLSSSLYPDYTTSYISSPYVGLGVGSYGCWINGVWTANCYL